jgi:hypothetical protein
MKVLYIAGPYRAEGHDRVLENILAARALAREAWVRGWAVICPHTNTILMNGPDIDEQTFLDGDIEILRRCDAILMLPLWKKSAGASHEHAVAVNLGLPIYESLGALPDERPAPVGPDAGGPDWSPLGDLGPPGDPDWSPILGPSDKQ